ncbi:MAG: CRISPR-associated endonuclease Cas3'' [Solirubrobacteraceae bacterium]
MTTAEDFDARFERATGHLPYDYQRALALRAEPPAVLEVPTGAGKTLAVLMAWLHDPDAPRRLVYALPMRTLVEQTETTVRDVLAKLGEDVDVHVLMGGAEPTDWRERPERRAVLVGTIDMLISRALNRGYAESRFQWPVAFGLLHSDCRWVFDEVQLMGPARTTSVQLDAMRERFGALARCQSMWVSATVDRAALLTVDRPELGETVGLSAADRQGPLARRLEAVKRLQREDLQDVKNAELPKRIAAALLREHRPATRSIVVLNRVQLAIDVATQLRKANGEAVVVLLHSRFRPGDRAERLKEALAAPGPAGVIVVATQVLEAGVDLSSALLATDTAPFSAVVQRVGRCNREGEHEEARVLWLDRGELNDKDAAPYHAADLAATRAELLTLDGESLSPATLEAIDVDEVREETAVLRTPDLLDLFDTAPDLSGADIDVAPYIRPDDDRSVSVAFRDIDPAFGVLDSEPSPARDELVTVPIGAMKDRRPWAFDHVDGTWNRTTSVRPGSVLLLPAADGGYSAEYGWTGRARDVPEVVPHPGAPAMQSFGSDATRAPDWVTLEQHLLDACDAATAITDALEIDPELALTVTTAAAAHDIGKAHGAFQQMLVATAPPAEQATLSEGLWAKSAHKGGRHVRRHFRHELASALALKTYASDVPDQALLRYLVAAHHGRVRVAIRPAPEEMLPPGTPPGTRFALGVIEGDVVPAVTTPLGTVPMATLSLVEMELGGGGDTSWTAAALSLRDAYGPFKLATLEALVRVADWQASGA